MKGNAMTLAVAFACFVSASLGACVGFLTCAALTIDTLGE